MARSSPYAGGARPACESPDAEGAGAGARVHLREQLLDARRRVAGVFLRGVGARAAVEDEVSDAVARVEEVVAGVAEQAILAGAADERVVAVPAADRVVAAVAADKVGRAVAGKRVGAIAADDVLDARHDAVVLAGGAVVGVAFEVHE